jgi:hypothetical protein
LRGKYSLSSYLVWFKKYLAKIKQLIEAKQFKNLKKYKTLIDDGIDIKTSKLVSVALDKKKVFKKKHLEKNVFKK